MAKLVVTKEEVNQGSLAGKKYEESLMIDEGASADNLIFAEEPKTLEHLMQKMRPLHNKLNLSNVRIPNMNVMSSCIRQPLWLNLNSWAIDFQLHLCVFYLDLGGPKEKWKSGSPTTQDEQGALRDLEL